jgi:shikimate dehydrogenase
MPLKEIGLRFATELDVTALESKALNTLVSTGDTWRGYNTDVLGFRHILKDCDFQSVAILGAGGTARAALVALRNYEVTPKVYRRSDARDQALRLANENVRILPWGSHPSAFEEDLLISTVPNSALADSQTEGSLKYIIEAIYNPWPTALKSFVKRAKYLSGKELLVAQAIPQIQLFTGRQVDFEGLTNVLLEVINSPQS